MLLLLITVLAAQVAEISVAAVEKRRLLLEVQRCSWCRRLVLSVRRKRGVTYDRDGGNLSTTVGLSLLTIVGAGAKRLGELACVLVLTAKMGGATGWGCCQEGEERWSSVGWDVEELVTVEKNFSQLDWGRAIVMGAAASIETIVMLLELKMTLLVHDDDGWGAGTISDGYAHGEWLGSLVIWQLWCWSEGWEKRGCFLELLERKEMMKASICFFLFCEWRLPLVKIVASFFFFI